MLAPLKCLVNVLRLLCVGVRGGCLADVLLNWLWPSVVWVRTFLVILVCVSFYVMLKVTWCFWVLVVVMKGGSLRLWTLLSGPSDGLWLKVGPIGIVGRSVALLGIGMTRRFEVLSLVVIRTAAGYMLLCVTCLSMMLTVVLVCFSVVSALGVPPAPLKPLASLGLVIRNYGPLSVVVRWLSMVTVSVASLLMLGGLKLGLVGLMRLNSISDVLLLLLWMKFPVTSLLLPWLPKSRRVVKRLSIPGWKLGLVVR